MNYQTYFRHIVMTMLLISCLPLLAQKKNYDEQHPVIIVGDWDKPPYEYQNDNGEPAGSNIDLMRAIMHQLGYPCKFVLKEWGNALKAFERGEADLIFANTNRYHKVPYYYTRNIINYYRIRALMIGDSVPSLSIRQMVKDGVVLKPSDYILTYFLNDDSANINRIEFQSPKVALLGLRDKDYKYFVWGEEPLKWKMREFSVENEGFILNEVNIPVTQIRIIGRDQDLINAIDDVYSRLKQSGEVEIINNRWFRHGDKSGFETPLSVYIILGILLLLVFCYLLNRLAQQHVKRASRHSTELNEMMLKALHMGHFYVMQYDIAHDQFTNHYGTFLPSKGLTLKEFVSHIYPTEQENFKKKMELMMNGREQKMVLDKRWNDGTPEEPKWLMLKGHSMVECDDNGRPRYIIDTINDITQDVEHEKASHDLVQRYKHLINIPLVSMSFYDSKGELITLNNSMKELCEFDKLGNEEFFRQTNMFSIPIFRDVYPKGSTGGRAACHLMDKPEGGKDTYIEFEIRPLTNKENQVVNYIVSAVDVTEEHERDIKMHKTSREILTNVTRMNQLEQQLKYILENTNMHVWQLDFQKKSILYTQLIHTPEHTMTFDEYIGYIADEEKDTARIQLENPEVWAHTFSANRHFNRPLVGEGNTERWYNISGIPIRDEEGNIKGAFGIIRDITAQLEAMQHLEEETLRAESSGQQKSMFLASMTHELRTPLNSIVGFSDLLRSVDNPDDRKQFIQIIRTHCDILIRLINDILEASEMSDAQMQILPRKIDFAKEFDNLCQSLEQRVDNPKVTFIKDNPYTTLPIIADMGRMQQVLTNFVTNAVKNTTEGHIKVGYRLKDERYLYVYCEDTGSGIPKEKQDAIFERFVKLNEFVQGTGLGLSICKNIIMRCGGKIGVDSEEGKGATFWFSIPVQLNTNN